MLPPSTFLLLLGISLCGTIAFTHFWLKETVLDSERTSDISLLEVISEYRIFFQPQQRYCRQAIFFMIVGQGNKVFKAGFQY